MEKKKHLKRLVLKEELFILTGKTYDALVLNQLIYWSERMKDSEGFIEEELKRARQYPDRNHESAEEIAETLKSGWIYMSSTKMIEENMIDVSRKTMDRIFERLVDSGWLSKRRNPKYKWDKTWQYRINLLKIQQDLHTLGYNLDGYALLSNNELTEDSEEENPPAGNNDNDSNENEDDSPNGQHDPSIEEEESDNKKDTLEELPNTHDKANDSLNGQHDPSMDQPKDNADLPKGHSDHSNGNPDHAIPEITTKTSLEIKKDLKDKDLNLNHNQGTELEQWNEYIWNMKLPMPLKKFFSTQVQVLVQDSTFDISEIEYFYNTHTNYIQPDCGPEDLWFLNDYEFTKLMKNMFTADIQRPIRNMEPLIKSYVQTGIFKKKERFQDNADFYEAHAAFENNTNPTS